MVKPNSLQLVWVKLRRVWFSLGLFRVSVWYKIHHTSFGWKFSYL